MRERNRLTRYDMYKFMMVVAISILYLLMNIAALNFLFASLGITMDKLQLFMIIVGIAFLTHNTDVYEKYKDSIRLYIHYRLLKSLGALLRSVLFLFITFGYFTYFS